MGQIGLGTSRLRSASSGLDHWDAVEYLRTARSLGVKFFDTANVYGQGDAERAIGDAFSKCRTDVIIASKLGYSMPHGSSFIRQLKPVAQLLTKNPTIGRLVTAARGQTNQRATLEYDQLSKMLHDSLARLQTDYIDLLQYHNPNHSIDGEFIYQFLTRSKDEGYCRSIGVTVSSHLDAQPWIDDGILDFIQVPAGMDQCHSLQTIKPHAVHPTRIIAREVLSGGRLFDPTWRSEAISHVDYPELISSMDPGNRDYPYKYLQWLLRNEMIDIVLIGTKSLKHLKTTVSAIQQGMTA